MKKILYLEPVGGVAGDMFLAAAIDLGVAEGDLRARLDTLRLPGWRFSTRRVATHSITGTHLDVLLTPDSPVGERSLVEIREIIRSANGLSPKVRERALEIFDLIGRAEAKIHEVPMEKIHFHEVGAVDSIVDICGASLALELLGEPEVYASAPPLGSGTVETAHGHLPVPTPATLELLRDRPVRFEGMGELTTPTGAALVRAFCKVESPPEFLLEKVGYGVGTLQLRDRPNVLRASLGRLVAEDADPTWVVEANLDDCNPQLLGSLIETMLELGAMDAFVLPATMKKSRPGHLVGVVVSAARRQAVVDALLRESTTLGVRHYPVQRVMLERSVEEVSTRFGPVRVKIGRRGEAVFNAQPEFEDCRRIAKKEKVPIKEVWAEALASYHRATEASAHDRQAVGSADSRFPEKDR
jgi:pyridinium-3,5-bisthiocarboxylic acid mononucleotide nickel chelatase